MQLLYMMRLIPFGVILLCLGTPSSSEVTPSHVVTDGIHKFIKDQVNLVYQNTSHVDQLIAQESNETETNTR